MGYRFGKVSAIKWWLWVYPDGVVICRDLSSLDKLVAYGIRPSQILVHSELDSATSMTVDNIDSQHSLVDNIEFVAVSEMGKCCIKK